MWVRYPYHCTDCDGNEWDEEASDIRVVLGPNSRIPPISNPRKYSYWKECDIH